MPGVPHQNFPSYLQKASLLRKKVSFIHNYSRISISTQFSHISSFLTSLLLFYVALISDRDRQVLERQRPYCAAGPAKLMDGHPYHGLWFQSKFSYITKLVWIG